MESSVGWPLESRFSALCVSQLATRAGLEPCKQGEQLTPITRAQAAGLWSGREAIAAGFSAAALYGTQWIDPQLPAELYRRNGKPVEGIVIHRDELSEDETRRNSRHTGDHAGPHGVRPRPPRPPLASAHRGRRPGERDPAAVIGRPTVSRAA